MTSKLSPFVRDHVDLIFPRAELYGKEKAVSFIKDGKWKTYTYNELDSKINIYASELISKGLKPGDRVAVIAEPGAHWIIALFGILRAGGIVVPLDIKWTSPELSAAISDCKPYAVVSSMQFLELAAQVKGSAIVLDMYGPEQIQLAKFPTLIGPSTAFIIYTSGTTGRPKGVMISFDTILFQTKNLIRGMEVNETDVFLSMIPLNHLFELTCGVLSPLRSGSEICFFASLYPEEIMAAIRERHVTRMNTVPLFLRMVRNAIERQIQKRSPAQQFIFKNLLKVGARIKHPKVKRVLFRQIHQVFGDCFQEFFCGHAPRETPIVELSRTVGIPVYQGYGMTEAGPVIATNFRNQKRIGSVGKPLEGTLVKIVKAKPSDTVGEIWVKGPHIMNGYYGQPELTEEVLDADGWLRTGDLGRLDSDGFLFVTGRLKTLIVLAGGKKVQPEEVEQVLVQAKSIKEACVLARPKTTKLLAGSLELCAVLVPEPQFADTEVLREAESLCLQLAPYKRPETFVIHREELPKTAARKIKRVPVLAWLQKQDAQSPEIGTS